jgi:hypothetical protein
MGSVRGKRKIWRKKDEAYNPHVIVQRWKGFQEFIWWFCFSYDKKGSWHIWDEETFTEKAECKEILTKWNAACYKDDKKMWEITQEDITRMGTRNKPETKPVFKYTEKTGAYILKEGKGGIN